MSVVKKKKENRENREQRARERFFQVIVPDTWWLQRQRKSLERSLQEGRNSLRQLEILAVLNQSQATSTASYFMLVLFL